MIEELKKLIFEQLASNQFFQGGLLITALSYVFYQLKGLPMQIWSRIERKVIFTVTIEEREEMYSYFEKWLAKHHNKSYRNVEAVVRKIEGERIIGSFRSYGDQVVHHEEPLAVDDTPVDEKVVYRQFSDTFVLWYKGIPLRVNKGREKMENASSFANIFYNSYTIKGFFAKRILSSLLDEVLEFDKKFRTKRFNIYASDEYGSWNRLNEIDIKDIDQMVIAGKDKLEDDISKFMNSREWYKERMIPYKRGYMFYGEPGNGKTSLALAIAKKLQYDIYFMKMAGLKERDLFSLFQDIGARSILVIEDIDASFTQRKSKDSNVSFSSLLNYLDGAFYKDGLITILTTNKPEKLDKALIRSGRIDFHLDVSNPSKELVERYLEIFYDETTELPPFTEPNLSMVDVQDLCIRNKQNKQKVVDAVVKKNCV